MKNKFLSTIIIAVALCHSLSAKTIVIVSHPGPGRHWADLLAKAETECTVIAAEEGAKELSKRGIPFTYFYQDSRSIKSLDEKEADQLAETVVTMCKESDCVITECGHSFAVRVEQKLEKIAPHIERVVYYDNPEPFVPGGYSEYTSKQIHYANAVLFANKKLVGETILANSSEVINLIGKRTAGLGYYPLEEIEKIKQMRSRNQLEYRKAFFDLHGLKDNGQKIVVYFGGANEEYYDHAFPAFCTIIKTLVHKGELTNTLFVIQQHPRARIEGNRDIARLNGSPHFVVSKEKDSDAMLSLADAVLYYQTSAAPKFVLSGIPTIQIGHALYVDVAVSSGLVSNATTSQTFLKIYNSLNLSPLTNDQLLMLQDKVGISEHWPSHLNHFLEEVSRNRKIVNKHVEL